MTYRSPWTYTAVAIAFAGIGIFIGRMLVGQNALCDLNSTGWICFRNWLGATSGWVATTVAAFSVYFIARQLVLQRRQMTLQRRQTAFALGNALPEFGWDQIRDAMSMFAPNTINLYVRNVNRRPLRIEYISISNSEIVMTVSMRKINELKTERVYDTVDKNIFKTGRNFFIDYALSGCDSVTVETPETAFELTFFRKSDTNTDLFGDEIIEVSIVYRLVGDQHEFRTKILVVDVNYFPAREDGWTRRKIR